MSMRDTCSRLRWVISQCGRLLKHLWCGNVGITSSGVIHASDFVFTRDADAGDARKMIESSDKNIEGKQRI